MVNWNRPWLPVLVALLLFTTTWAPAQPALASHGGTLTVSVIGSGTVTSDPAGINCGADCTEEYPSDCAFDPEIGVVICEFTEVTLTASPAPGWTFVGWGGACTGTAPCSLMMTHGHSVTALFRDPTPPSVVLTLPANGAVVGSEFTAAASASDPQTGIARVEFLLNGSIRSTDTTAPYSALVSTSEFGHGSVVQVKAWAVNGVGLTGESLEAMVTVDLMGPILALTAGPDEASTAFSNSASFEFSSDDTDVAEYWCRLGSGTFSLCASPKVYDDLELGEHTFSVYSIDEVGNQGNTVGRSWSVDHPFTDISEDQFEIEIAWLYFQEITLGCNEAGTLFCPTLTVSREQMASFLARALKLPEPEDDYFTDDEGSPHENDINKMFEAEITLGCGGTNYCPQLAVSREQMASFLARALKLPEPVEEADYFTDDDDSEFHENDINKMFEAGITLGCGGTNYCPLLPVSREQMAAFLFRASSP